MLCISVHMCVLHHSLVLTSSVTNYLSPDYIQNKRKMCEIFRAKHQR